MPTVVSVNHTGTGNDLAQFTIGTNGTSVDWECSLSAGSHPQHGPSVANFAIRPVGGGDLVYRSHSGTGTTTDSGNIELDAGDYEIEVWHTGAGTRDITASGSVTYTEVEAEYYEGGKTTNLICDSEISGSKRVEQSISANLVINVEGLGELVIEPELKEGGKEAINIISIQTEGEKLGRAPPSVIEKNIDVEASGYKILLNNESANLLIYPEVSGFKFIENNKEANLIINVEGYGYPELEDYSEDGKTTSLGIESEGNGIKLGEAGESTSLYVEPQGFGNKVIYDESEQDLFVQQEATGEKLMPLGESTIIVLGVEGSGEKTIKLGEDTNLIVEVEGSGQQIIIEDGEGFSETNLFINVQAKGEKNIKDFSEANLIINELGNGFKIGLNSAEEELKSNTEIGASKFIESFLESYLVIDIEAGGVVWRAYFPFSGRARGRKFAPGINSRKHIKIRIGGKKKWN